MSLMPDGPGRIRVTGQDDTVIFEGEGQVILNTDPELSHLPGQAVLRVREGDYHAQVDLTGLLQVMDHSVEVDYDSPPFTWDPDPDPVVVIEPPRRVLTRLRIDIPSSLALSIRREIYQGHPDHQRRDSFQDLLRGSREDRADLTMGEVDRIASAGADWYREWVRILSTRAPSARQQLVRMLEEHIVHEPPRYDPADIYAMGVLTPEAARELVGLDDAYEAREELMRSTRAEFPHDPYGYGRACPAGPMRWTPPEDGEEVRPCP